MNPLKSQSVTALAAVAVLLILSGCVVTSVHPFYSSADVITDPAFVGVWRESQNPDSTETWTIAPGSSDAKSYTVTVNSKEPVTYQTHLFKLGEYRFIDLVPTETHGDFVPPHYLLRLIAPAPGLQISLMNHDWLRDELRAKPDTVQHLNLNSTGKPQDDRYVLTADTRALQSFLMKALKQPAAWNETNGFERVKAAKAP